MDTVKSLTTLSFSPGEESKSNRLIRSGRQPVNFDAEKIVAGAKLLLEGMGEDVERQGLLDTPARIARMYAELVSATNADPADEITCTFSEDTDGLVLVRDIPFASICEHHLVPFIGVAHVAYIPAGGLITGLSKLARVVEVAAKRLQVQERLTAQIADALMKKLSPNAVVVVMEAEHLCMSIRGIKKPGSKTVTSAIRGEALTDQAMRAEIMALITRG
jgi:GTP cyclohydrolase I